MAKLALSIGSDWLPASEVELNCSNDRRWRNGWHFRLDSRDMAQGNSIEPGRTVAVNTLILFVCFYLFNSRHISASVLNEQGLTGKHWRLIAITILLVFQLSFTYLPPMQTLCGTAVLEFSTGCITTLVAASVVIHPVLEELEEFIMKGLTA